MEMKMENDDCGNKSIILLHGIAPVYCFIISRYPRARAGAWSRVMDLFLPRHGGASYPHISNTQHWKRCFHSAQRMPLLGPSPHTSAFTCLTWYVDVKLGRRHKYHDEALVSIDS